MAFDPATAFGMLPQDQRDYLTGIGEAYGMDPTAWNGLRELEGSLLRQRHMLGDHPANNEINRQILAIRKLGKFYQGSPGASDWGHQRHMAMINAMALKGVDHDRAEAAGVQPAAIPWQNYTDPNSTYTRGLQRPNSPQMSDAYQGPSSYVPSNYMLNPLGGTSNQLPPSMSYANVSTPSSSNGMYPTPTNGATAPSSGTGIMGQYY